MGLHWNISLFVLFLLHREGSVIIFSFEFTIYCHEGFFFLSISACYYLESFSKTALTTLTYQHDLIDAGSLRLHSVLKSGELFSWLISSWCVGTFNTFPLQLHLHSYLRSHFEQKPNHQLQWLNFPRLLAELLILCACALPAPVLF